MKYRFHPSIVAIKKNSNSGLSFSFSQVERHETMKEINNLKTSKATQSGSPILWLTGSVSLYWEIPSIDMILEKNSFKIGAVFLLF